MLDDDNFQTLSDLMSAMLFVFIITLVAYIINFSANRDLTQSVGTEIVDKDLKVSSLVRAVSHRLSGYAIDHSLDLENGVISISSDRLGFPAGEHELSFMAQTAISFVEKAILSEIECKESMHFNSEKCDGEYVAELDTIFVEGHTDNVPFRPRNGLRDNIDLSLLRAASVIKKFGGSEGNRQIFVPVGYGEAKPVVEHVYPTADSRNRRISLKFTLKRPWRHFVNDQ